MKIKANNNFGGSLDLSSKEDYYNKNPLEKLPFRLTIKANQTVIIDDKWYTLNSIQSALKAGYIQILDFKEQHVFTQEIKIPESYTTYYDFTLVEILNRADYPQDAFEKINQNFIDIDTLIHSGGGGGAVEFIQLTDVPHSYAGSSNSAVAVNSGANGLTFTNLYIYDTHVDVGSNTAPMNLNVYGACNVSSLMVGGRMGSNIGAILVTLPNLSVVTKYLIGGLIYDYAGSNVGQILIGLPDGSTLIKYLMNGLIFDSINSPVGSTISTISIGLSDGSTIYKHLVNGFIYDLAGGPSTIAEILIGLSDGTTISKFVTNGIISDF